MPTVPELLRHDLLPGQEVAVVLRSGVQISGVLEAVDLAAGVVQLGGWTLRVEEIAGVRAEPAIARVA
jgi:hypothetical protein